MHLEEIFACTDGLAKTAALVAWIQGLYESERPVLVGGAAVELLTGGAYTTGDLDFVGQVSEDVERKLRASGFEKKGRHWIHEAGQLFVEFPAEELGSGESSVELEVAGHSLRVLAPEAVLVDRLAAWEFWKSTTDAVNAFMVLRALENRLEDKTLEELAEAREVEGALERLRAFSRRFRDSEPSQEELIRWADRRES